jgi:DNA invertase Pin-like site-specific DNA recombinase
MLMGLVNVVKGVGFLSLWEGRDPFPPMGEFVLTCMMAMAKLEREHIRSRVNAGITAATAEGKPGAGGSQGLVSRSRKRRNWPFTA